MRKAGGGFLVFLALAGISLLKNVSVLPKESDRTVESAASIPHRPATLCEFMQQHSPMSLWTEHLDKIFAASQMDIDKKFALHDMTAHILQLVTPRLALGQRSLPREGAGRVIEKLQARWDSLQRNASDATPKVRILVLGGSVTKGVLCKTGVRHYNNVGCSWPARLEHLINTMAGRDVIEVVNLSAGGTNTKTGTTLMEFGLIPPEARDPDIVINAFATNDMHVLTMREAANNNMTLRDKTFTMAQNFTRVVMGDPCAEKRPLLLFLDDYLGNEQRSILQTTELSQGLQVLANYYGYGLVSYPDVVRDWVYGTTTETAFSPAGWHKENKEGMFREIHPGAGAYIAMTYVLAFYLLQMVSVSCSLPWEPSITHYVGGYGLPRLRGATGLSAPPRATRKALPPSLEPTLLLDNVSELWDNAVSTERREESECARSDQIRCPFAWVSGVSQARQQHEILRYMEPYLIEPAGWELRDDRKKKGDARKYGFLPKTAGAVLTMKLSLEQDTSTVAVFFLKSYGDTWENSACTVSIASSGDGRIVTTQQLHGFHHKETSEMYSEIIHLPEPVRKFEIRFQHSDGKTFKLMGVAACS